jgi:hypothetical protein
MLKLAKRTPPGVPTNPMLAHAGNGKYLALLAGGAEDTPPCLAPSPTLVGHAGALPVIDPDGTGDIEPDEELADVVDDYGYAVVARLEETAADRPHMKD